MDAIAHIEMIRKYCDRLEGHLNNVGTAWGLIQKKCGDMDLISDEFHRSRIDRLVRNHDLSKVSKEEFIPYCGWFFPVDDSTHTSASDFVVAWEHHKANNPHHWQNWTIDDTEHWKYHCVCMVVDWVAMGIEFDDTAQSYYEGHKHEISLPAHGIALIYEIFNRLGE